jgi:hypothetical protein
MALLDFTTHGIPWRVPDASPSRGLHYRNDSGGRNEPAQQGRWRTIIRPASALGCEGIVSKRVSVQP